MCGFSGYFSINKKNKFTNISQYHSLKHRGPDEYNIFKNDNFYCRFYRLNIIGGTDGRQPMISKNKRFLMVFNGEIYNFKELSEEYLPSKQWTQKELLSEEFKSIGFYLTNHPLNEFDEIFNQLNIISYNQFYENEKNEGLVAGTIMSIQEKKSNKGTPYAIIKFSDKQVEFELFLFAEILVENRARLKESESFVLTLQKDKISGEATKKRINIKKIINLEDVINKPYSKVTIELKNDYDLEEIKKLLEKKGETKINLVFKDQNKKAYFTLKENRKFDLNHLKVLKAKKYVEKISV